MIVIKTAHCRECDGVKKIKSYIKTYSGCGKTLYFSIGPQQYFGSVITKCVFWQTVAPQLMSISFNRLHNFH